MDDTLSRTRLLIGQDGIERLYGARVAVFGIGGVGGFVCEALARSGVGGFELVDSDMVSMSNINRQIIATLDTVGRFKTEVMAEHDYQVVLANTYHLYMRPGVDVVEEAGVLVRKAVMILPPYKRCNQQVDR